MHNVATIRPYCQSTYEFFTMVLPLSIFLASCSSSLCVAAGTSPVAAVNPDFNDASGWSTSNDAVLGHPGGVAPWSWTTPVAGVMVGATETVLPVEGSGLGLTYAGADNFSQTVTFPTTGQYTFLVEANAVAGTRNGASPLVDDVRQLRELDVLTRLTGRPSFKKDAHVGGANVIGSAGPRA